MISKFYTSIWFNDIDHKNEEDEEEYCRGFEDLEFVVVPRTGEKILIDIDDEEYKGKIEGIVIDVFHYYEFEYSFGVYTKIHTIQVWYKKVKDVMKLLIKKNK